MMWYFVSSASVRHAHAMITTDVVANLHVSLSLYDMMHDDAERRSHSFYMVTDASDWRGPKRL